MASQFNPTTGEFTFYKSEVRPMGTGGYQIGDRSPVSIAGSFSLRYGLGVLELCPSAIQSVVMGTFAGNAQTDGVQDCTLIGQEVCSLSFGPRGVAMSGVTGVGSQALFFCNGDFNTGLGYQAGVNVTSSKGGLYLGYQAGFFNDTDNRLYIGNSNSSNLITGKFDLGQVGINIDANSIPSCAALIVESTTGGFLKPRMTTAQRNLLTPVAGLEIYNSTTARPEYWDGSAWNSMKDTTGSGGSSAPVIRHYTTSQTITNERYVSSDGTNAITFTLPSALTATDAITFAHAGTLDLTITGAQTINGNANIQLRGGARQSITIFPSNNLWWIA